MKFRYVPALAVILAGPASPLAAQQPTLAPAPPPVPAPGVGDPFIKDSSGAPAPPPGAGVGARTPLPAECVARMEVFTLPQADGRKAMRQFPNQADLYAWLGTELVNEKSVVKLEHLSLLRVRGGQRSRLEEIAEYPYPTEFDPPQIPQSIGIGLPVSAGAQTTVTNNPPAPTPAPAPAPTPAPAPAVPPGARGVPGEAGAPGGPGAPVVAPGSVPAGRAFPPWPYTPTTPSAFATRNTGWTTEIELTVGEDGYTVDMVLAPEFVKFCGLVSQSPNGEIMQPTFETSKFTGAVGTVVGQPTFVGTLSPAIAAGVEAGNTKDVTRLLFITLTNPR